MSNQNNLSGVLVSHGCDLSSSGRVERIHPSWMAFIQYCVDLQHGEIERLKIQDGLPMLAEVIKEKIKFTR